MRYFLLFLLGLALKAAIFKVCGVWVLVGHIVFSLVVVVYGSCQPIFRINFDLRPFYKNFPNVFFTVIILITPSLFFLKNFGQIHCLLLANTSKPNIPYFDIFKKLLISLATGLPLMW